MAYEPKVILLLTGTVGTGKTSVAAEIGEQLDDIGLRNAVVDMDWLGWVNAGDDYDGYDLLIMQKLISVWPNYHSIGIEYLVLARGLIHREPVDLLKRTFPNSQIKIIRLIAAKETTQKRLSQRDRCETLREHISELDEMNQLMDKLHLENIIISTDGRSVEAIAAQITSMSGWQT